MGYNRKYDGTHCASDLYPRLATITTFSKLLHVVTWKGAGVCYRTYWPRKAAPGVPHGFVRQQCRLWKLWSCFHHRACSCPHFSCVFMFSLSGIPRGVDLCRSINERKCPPSPSGKDAECTPPASRNYVTRFSAFGWCASCARA